MNTIRYTPRALQCKAVILKFSHYLYIRYQPYLIKADYPHFATKRVRASKAITFFKGHVNWGTRRVKAEKLASLTKVNTKS